MFRSGNDYHLLVKDLDTRKEIDYKEGYIGPEDVASIEETNIIPDGALIHQSDKVPRSFIGVSRTEPDHRGAGTWWPACARSRS